MVDPFCGSGRVLQEFKMMFAALSLAPRQASRHLYSAPKPQATELLPAAPRRYSTVGFPKALAGVKLVPRCEDECRDSVRCSRLATHGSRSSTVSGDIFSGHREMLEP